MARAPEETTRDLEWNDLRLILAIARSGSLSGAARELGQTHSTVFRRINGVEEKTGVRFFDRHPHGYEATGAGNKTLAIAEKIEAQVDALSLEILGSDRALSGRVRLTSPEAFAEDLAPAILASFYESHPDIQVDLSPGHGAVDLAKREAEVAIRATRQPPEASFGKKICNFRFALYAAEDYLEKHNDLPLADQKWCLIEGSTSWLAPLIFKSNEAAVAQTTFQSRATRAVLNAAAQGLGMTMLPCYFADRYDNVIRASDTISALDMTLWVLTHPDLKETARVRALMTHLYDTLGQNSDLYAGETRTPNKYNLFPRA